MAKTKKTVLTVTAIVLLAAAAACFAFAFALFPPAAPSSNAVDLGSSSSDPTFKDEPKEEEIEIVDNPIDFDAQAELYPDIYAWLRVDGTDVDFPVVQHPMDDFFYLDHNAEGVEDDRGAIYTQMCNSKDMLDPVTVIYGHNMNLSGEMLNQLMWLQDKDFFDSHEYFEIYVPGRILKYRIISAYAGDDRHIMNSFDFSDEPTRMQYFESVCNPNSMIANVRDGASLTSDDRIVQISTCMSDVALRNERFIVTGVLVETQLTR